MLGFLASLKLSALLNACPGGIAQGLIWGVMALGLFLTYKVLGFSDLTVDGSLATGGAICVMFIMMGYSPVLGMAAAFVTGILAGCATGLLHTLLGIPDILSGILTQISLYSINLNILNGKANQAINLSAVDLLITSNIKKLGMTIAVLLAICAVIIGVIYWYLGTEQGSSIRATGANANMARAQGINTNAMKVLTLMIANGFVALSGAMLSQFQGFADVNMGRGAIVVGLAAIIIGQVIGDAVAGKRLNFAGRLVFVVVGAVIYYLVYVFVIWLKFPPNDMKLLTAIVVAVFLAVPYLQDHSKNSFSHLAKVNKKKAEGK